MKKLSNTGNWDYNNDEKWIDPYLTAKPMSELFEPPVLILQDMEVNYGKIGCEKCNYEGFLRDYDGTWLKDCECSQ